MNINDMSIYDLIEQMDKGGDLGNTYRVDPKAGTVERVNDSIVSEYVMWDDETIEWPKGLDYRWDFHPSEFLEASNWEWHLNQFIEDSIPFRFQTEAISTYGNWLEDEESDLIGWVLMVVVDPTTE